MDTLDKHYPITMADLRAFEVEANGGMVDHMNLKQRLTAQSSSELLARYDVTLGLFKAHALLEGGGGNSGTETKIGLLHKASPLIRTMLTTDGIRDVKQLAKNYEQVCHEVKQYITFLDDNKSNTFIAEFRNNFTVQRHMWLGHLKHTSGIT